MQAPDKLTHANGKPPTPDVTLVEPIPAENTWLFNERLSQRLLRINLINVAVGLLLQRNTPFWRGVGAQAVGWGAINIAIAVVGRWQQTRRFKTLEQPYAGEVLRKDARNLRRVLLINMGLNPLYVAGGLSMVRRGQMVEDEAGERLRATGWGIVAQGALLMLFDTFHVLRVPAPQDHA